MSVRDQVGFYERNELKVRDELEVLARNEAPDLHADTLQAIDEPLNGEQRFTAYACRGARAQSATAASTPSTSMRKWTRPPSVRDRPSVTDTGPARCVR